MVHHQLTTVGRGLFYYSKYALAGVGSNIVSTTLALMHMCVSVGQPRREAVSLGGNERARWKWEQQRRT